MNNPTNKDIVFYSYISLHFIIASVFYFGFNGSYRLIVGLVSTPVLFVVMITLIIMKQTKINDWFEKDFNGFKRDV